MNELTDEYRLHLLAKLRAEQKVVPGPDYRNPRVNALDAIASRRDQINTRAARNRGRG